MILVAAALSIALAGGWIGWHAVRRHGERERFSGERTRFQADDERVRANEERDQLLDRVQQQFPHAADELERHLLDDGATDETIRSVLAAVPGVRIGETPNGWPVVLPDAVRTRQVCGWGRTGTGKSAFCERLIVHDFLAKRSVVVMATETEVYRDHVLPKVPPDRVKDVVYFAPAREDCPVKWNVFDVPKEDRARAALELFTVFRRVLGEESIGPQSDPIARNTFLALVGMPGATFLTAQEFLENQAFRTRLLPKIEDPRCRLFWSEKYERFGRAAARPFLNRLELFAGAAPGVRQTLCPARSNFSIGNVIDSGGILLADFSGFDPETTRILGQAFLAYLQIAVARRERMPEAERPLCMLYADEFSDFGHSTAALRFLASKGRRHKLAQVVLSQFPSQLDPDTRAEIFGNSGVVLSLAVSAQEANFIRRELLIPMDDGPPEAVAAEDLVSLPVGCGYVRLGTGALAVPVRLDPPLKTGDPVWGDQVRVQSWARFVETGADAQVTDPALDASLTRSKPSLEIQIAADPAPTPGLSSDEQRYLDAVRSTPGRNSSEYAKLARMNGVAALACRRRLVAAGLIREHQVATGRRGRQAIVLEPVPEGGS